MTDFLYFQTVVQFRVPVTDDGRLGDPEIVKRFTSPYNGAQKAVKKKVPKKKQEPRTLTNEGIEYGEL